MALYFNVSESLLINFLAHEVNCTSVQKCSFRACALMQLGFSPC